MGLILSDIKFYWKKVGLLFALNSGFQAIVLYRIGHWSFSKNRRLNPIWYLYLLFVTIHRLFNKIELPPSAILGKHLYLPHPYGLVMAAKVVVGDNCTIGPWVVIGHLNKNGNPVIGNGVYIGPRACILGNISIGDESIVGAMALVVESVPAGAKVLGIKGVIKIQE